METDGRCVIPHSDRVHKSGSFEWERERTRGLQLCGVVVLAHPNESLWGKQRGDKPEDPSEGTVEVAPRGRGDGEEKEKLTLG